MNIQDVPSPIDLRNPQDALQWAEQVNQKRPWRYEFFDYYVNLIQNLYKEKQFKDQDESSFCVLEIGSGPGFFAKHLLSQCPDIFYTALDFSEPMHELSKSKLSSDELARAEYVIQDFKQDDWNNSLGKFDAVIIHQALHELRHKEYASQFHQQIKKLLKHDAIYLVCDHIFADEAMQNNELYMSKHEHFQCIKQAGYTDIELVKEIKGLCLFECYL
ncbi:class I SAM-dependent methyltransferase [Acinetobacter bereziniae]|jgi:SAM-dependent methyltransferase|uniref:class I SAM-dependent methyltransferase n=1 Tax=Acinetobacter bereziniae TaxID=106648 RepID=UPI00111780C6|nr:class I SAM-dependent methyltransferase [Acinetobacter bereziniae]MBJ8453517.1 class I SAM-dependent methyltransferase [Acinetobacter bereziniae]MBJ8458348.1 class I SAM-dependent methyltransferase [Acinetobacter bereziniae]MDM1786619.1 class I SAM-dependent methyltransferase [Acinetobacter bereziniae]TNL45812.1 class I SAM-dependent methyltransferase [Acinetobacter bereziniae]TNL53327.1 class I SAM-dependent methyltransferase [Acinetobacter bereziniae]